MPLAVEGGNCVVLLYYCLRYGLLVRKGESYAGGRRELGQLRSGGGGGGEGEEEEGGAGVRTVGLTILVILLFLFLICSTLILLYYFYYPMGRSCDFWNDHMT